MNSLLNVELRERRGLVYNVESSANHLSSTGFLTVYFGCDAEDTQRCIDICADTMRRLSSMDADVLRRRLDRAKRQYLGQFRVASENRENRIMSLARTMLYLDTLPGDDEVTQRIMNVEPDDICLLAERLSNPSSLIFMPGQ